jgi:hypothetical protein
MANRVILGETASGVHGVRISKPGINALTGAAKDMLFDSTSVRTGMVYAGGQDLTLNDSADNYLTTGSKASLGYIPLVIFSEKNNGEIEFDDLDVSLYCSEISSWKTTTSTVTPVTCQVGGVGAGNQLVGGLPANGRGYDGISSANENAINVNYFVLRIPCAFGYMNNTYFG